MKINQYSPPVPLNKRISSFLLNAILYPYSVIKKYNEYNIRITEIANELKDEGIFRIKKNNVKIVFLFIHLPILIGLLFFLLSSLENKEDYYKFYKIITYENKSISPTIIDNISFLFKKIKKSFRRPVFRKKLLYSDEKQYAVKRRTPQNV